MSSVIAYLQKATMSSFSFQRPQCLHLKNDNIFLKKSENENENELNEKRKNFNVFMPSRVLLLGFALVVSRVNIQIERN